MRHKLSQEYKFAARTSPELYEHFNGFVLRMAAQGDVKFRGRKLGVEAAVNAIVIQFLDLSEPERARVLAEFVPRYEALLGHGDPDSPATHRGQPVVPTDVEAIEPGSDGGDSASAPKRRARKAR